MKNIHHIPKSILHECKDVVSGAQRLSHELSNEITADVVAIEEKAKEAATHCYEEFKHFAQGVLNHGVLEVVTTDNTKAANYGQDENEQKAHEAEQKVSA